jgi:hypothetical protein
MAPMIPFSVPQNPNVATIAASSSRIMIGI